jgi:hypothetical protein
VLTGLARDLEKVTTPGNVLSVFIRSGIVSFSPALALSSSHILEPAQQICAGTASRPGEQHAVVIRYWP